MWIFNPDNRMQLSNRLSGASKNIKSTESRILKLLLDHQDQVVSKDVLIAETWGSRVVSDSSLTQAIAHLRLALGDNGREQKIIKTLPKEGYQLNSGSVCFDTSYLSKSLEASSDHAEENSVSSYLLETELAQVQPQRRLPWVKKTVVNMLALVVFIVSTLVFIWAGSIYLQNEAIIKQPWSVKMTDGTTFYVEDSRASEMLYNELAGKIVQNVSRLFISKNHEQFYLACVYHSDKHQDRQILNLTFTINYTVDEIRAHVNENCR
ncbi:winged helix-turn-helix domain-containing protein [Vibrio sp. CAU 1672]|uniref:winged helix-turn-helix domain-containing protein n=1 Tax=Vibrio sp. CAU 1672 TaxID=3032594 RepID=UPI0023DBED47|nr:winged helix-turn-helix domain-containing protein [Vibrio sp. CAU 1672]MDF2152829.1 winged helix-turn-helix domain-containing protein [Vibrio sp. CAU 1672]